MEEAVLGRVEDRISIKLRSVGHALDANHAISYITLHEGGMQPYHFQKNQALLQPEYENHLTIPNFLISRLLACIVLTCTFETPCIYLPVYLFYYVNDKIKILKCK